MAYVDGATIDCGDIFTKYIISFVEFVMRKDTSLF